MSFATYPSLSGKTVIVSGGASGIGADIVAAFAAQGARVGLLDLDADAAAQMEATHKGVAAEVCDLRDIDALRAGVAALRTRLGPTDVLVNNAARDDRHNWADVTPNYWDDRQATNLRHMFFAI
ncbi:MAG: SDR family NAD(P)-dependent oxidoreductase, partial [Pseudomonadota bacterium]